ncbi:MAG: ABC transporter substrate-binding protein [Halanaerobiaceae bacterium]
MSKRSMLSGFLIVLLVIFTLIINLALKEDEVLAQEDTGGFKVNVISLSGGDYGYPSPYSHYPRGPGGYKRNLIFDSLLERGEDGLIPWLARDYEIKNGGKEYLFTLQENVKWHDGEPFTAEDVKFSFEYGLEHPLVWSDLTEDDIDSVEIVNENQVLITAATINSSLLYNIAKQRIIPEHIWKDVEVPKEYGEEDAVIGTGPYLLTDYNKEHGTYRFDVFKDFWGPQQSIKTIKFIPVSEGILAFEKGQIDLTDLSPDLLGRYQNNTEYKIAQKPAFWGYRLILNMEDVDVLKDQSVRQAFAYAVDKKELIEKIERGAAVAGSAGILPPDHVYYNPEVKNYEYNPDMARKLLKENGYDSLTFDLKVSSRAVRMAELIKEQLARVGVEIRIISADTKTQDSRINNNDYQLAITGHGGWGGEPDYLIDRFASEELTGSISSSGAVGYNNEQLNSLLIKQKNEFNSNERRKLLYQAQNILAEDVPELPLYYTSGYTVYRPDKYDGWIFMYDHHSLTHSKLSYLERK